MEFSRPLYFCYLVMTSSQNPLSARLDDGKLVLFGRLETNDFSMQFFTEVVYNNLRQ